MEFFRVLFAYAFANAHARAQQEKGKKERYSCVFVRLFCELVFGFRISVLNFAL